MSFKGIPPHVPQGILPGMSTGIMPGVPQMIPPRSFYRDCPRSSTKIVLDAPPSRDPTRTSTLDSPGCFSEDFPRHAFSVHPKIYLKSGKSPGIFLAILHAHSSFSQVFFKTFLQEILQVFPQKILSAIQDILPGVSSAVLLRASPGIFTEAPP